MQNECVKLTVPIICNESKCNTPQKKLNHFNFWISLNATETQAEQTEVSVFLYSSKQELNLRDWESLPRGITKMA